MPVSPLERFSNRVDDYDRYRPGYPHAALDRIRDVAGLTADSSVADVGSGTGILTRQLLEMGCLVYAVEPNAAMRGVADKSLSSFPKFHSIAATAERTGLPAGCVDLITAAQAFHWFDVAKTRDEFLRILRPHGQVALLWNRRQENESEFSREYEALLVEFGQDYLKVRHQNAQDPSRLNAFFAAGYEHFVFHNRQEFDWEGLRGRLLSCSYIPPLGDPRNPAMLERLREIFDRHSRQSRIEMNYDTDVYIGRL